MVDPPTETYPICKRTFSGITVKYGKISQLLLEFSLILLALLKYYQGGN